MLRLPFHHYLLRYLCRIGRLPYSQPLSRLRLQRLLEKLFFNDFNLILFHIFSFVNLIRQPYNYRIRTLNTILLSPNNHLFDLLITFFRYEFAPLNAVLCCVYEGNHTNLLAIQIIFGWLYASYFLSINQHLRSCLSLQ